MDGWTLRVVEQAQRFYSGSEPVPDDLVENFLQLKALDPLLGALAGYTLIRQGKTERYRGQPATDLPAGQWSMTSAMQNMLHHFGLLPDSHVLAGLCEPARRDEHFAAAMERGVPLFTEGFRALLDHYESEPGKLRPGMRHARRTLAAGSPFSAWMGYEPALEIRNGEFARPPVAWSMLKDFRDRIRRESAAVGAIRIQSLGSSSYRTAFLVAPDLILAVNHAVKEPLGRDATFSFARSDRADDPAVAPIPASLVAVDDDKRLALLRLASPPPDATPLPLAPIDAAPKPDQRVYLIGYPFLHTDLDPALVEHVFGENLGTKRLQPGYIVSAPADKYSFDYDAFTLGGSAGSPVIDLDTGFVLGLHWGGKNDDTSRRGRATALWKPDNLRILREAGI
jgi:hypothetical protein